MDRSRSLKKASKAAPALVAAAASAALVAALMAAMPSPAAAAKCATIGYENLIMAGDKPGTSAVPFMQLYGGGKIPIRNADNTVALSDAPDAITFHQVGGDIAMISHTEFPQPGGLWVSTLKRSVTSGKLTATRAVNLDVTAVNGVGAMCAGTVFNGAHLGGEEYPNDCRSAAAASVETARFYGYYTGEAVNTVPNPPNKGNYADAANTAIVASQYSCYNMGAVVEVKPFKSSSTRQLDGKVTKLRTMGRMSHETAVVAPDRKTVLLPADDRMGMFGMFVADKSGDLQSGSLYAAKFTNQKGGDATTGLGTTWDVEWVLLGKGKQAVLNPLASNPSTKFSNIFETAEVDVNTWSCPAGFSYVSTNGSGYLKKNGAVERYVECLKVKPGMEMAAAFLESQRYAAIKGATTEFEKLEGVDYSKELKRWYVAISSIDRGMLDGSLVNYKHDIPTGNNIRLPKNKCGLIIEMAGFDTTGAKSWQPTTARVILAGKPLSTPDSAGNTCDANGISSPDNLMVVPGTSSLLIAEDTDWHTNNVLWAADVSDTTTPPALTRIVSAPKGAEVTGLSPATISRHSYVAMAFQHPDAPAKASVGYLGPFPKDAFSPLRGNKPRPLSFAGIEQQTGGAGEGTVVGTKEVCY